MFGISLFELVVVMAVVLIFLGPDKMPEAARSLGRLMASLKRNSDALRREFYNTVYAPTEEIKNRVELSTRDLIGMLNTDPGSLNCEEKARAEELKRKEEAEASAKAAETNPEITDIKKNG